MGLEVEGEVMWVRHGGFNNFDRPAVLFLNVAVWIEVSMMTFSLQMADTDFE
jgi:hypothetical protein